MLTTAKAWAQVAQAVINITEGQVTIEKDSPIHKAMVYLVRKYVESLTTKEN